VKINLVMYFDLKCCIPIFITKVIIYYSILNLTSCLCVCGVQSEFSFLNEIQPVFFSFPPHFIDLILNFQVNGTFQFISLHIHRRTSSFLSFRHNSQYSALMKLCRHSCILHVHNLRLIHCGFMLFVPLLLPTIHYPLLVAKLSI
jgi:hypothetical protein